MKAYEGRIKRFGAIRNGKWMRRKNQGRLEYFSLRSYLGDQIIYHYS